MSPPRAPSFAIALQRALTSRLLALPEPLLLRLSGRGRDLRDGQPLDAQTQLLVAVGERIRRPLNVFSPERARVEFRSSMQLVAHDARPGVAREPLVVGSAEQPLAARVYRPRDLRTPAPVLVYFHGGGFVVGDLDSHDSLCAVLAEDGRCLVVSVDYRLAPEHRFPAAALDAIAAHAWVVENAASLGGDAARVAVGGDSAGGTLAAVVALAAKEGNPAPCFQLLFYPSCDGSMSSASHRTFGRGYLLSGELKDWFYGHFTRDASDRDDPRLSPLAAPDVAGVAPALILTAGYDPLRDEGRAYADRLEAAGVSVRHRCFTGLVHGFASMGVVAEARAAVAFAATELRARLGGAIDGPGQGAA